MELRYYTQKSNEKTLKELEKAHMELNNVINLCYIPMHS